MTSRLFSVAFLVLAGLFSIGCGSSTETTSVPDEKDSMSFANTACPMMGEAIDPDLAIVWNGKKIGFCCDKCIPEWGNLSDEQKADKLASIDTASHEGHSEHEHGEKEKESAEQGK